MLSHLSSHTHSAAKAAADAAAATITSAVHNISSAAVSAATAKAALGQKPEAPVSREAASAAAAAAVSSKGLFAGGNGSADAQPRARQLPPLSSRSFPYPWSRSEIDEKWLFQVGDMCRRKDLMELPCQVR